MPGKAKKIVRKAQTEKKTMSATKTSAPRVETLKQEIVNTPIDKMMRILEEKKSVSLKQLGKDLNWSVETVERIGKTLERIGLVDVQYPALILQKPRIAFVKSLPKPKVQSIKGTKLHSKQIVVDFVPAKVSVIQKANESIPSYSLDLPVFGAYTKVFLEELKEEIAEKVPVEVSEIMDTEKSKALKLRFLSQAKEELSKYFGETETEISDMLAGTLLHSMYGLGVLEMLMADDDLEEVAINSSKTPITVYHKKYGWMKTNISMESEEEIANYASQIGRKVGREITNLNPILDAHLITGDRVNASLSPISTNGNTITIRRFARKPWTVIDFIGKSHTMNLEMASLLWLAIQYEMSILFAGGTASGKTSMLSSLCAFIPGYHRVISIEDVREVTLPERLRWNWLPMNTRNPNPEGLGEVKMLELMQTSLRMRPDRIILGEIRRKREAEVLFEALHTGHSVYSTLHANSAEQVIRRLLEPPISLPSLQVEGLDLVVVQYRDRKNNRRRTFEIAEIESGRDTGQLEVNTVFKWNPRTDDWDTLNPATKLVGSLNLHTGMTEKEITKTLEDRATILNWMREKKYNNIDTVGRIFNEFYANPEKVVNAAKENKPMESLWSG